MKKSALFSPLSTAAIASVMLLGSTLPVQASRVVMDQGDDASVIISRNYHEGLDRTIVRTISAVNPEVLEVVSNLDCARDVTAGACAVTLRLHKNGPVNLRSYSTNQSIPYGPGLVDTEADSLSIDLDFWGGNEFFLGWALTEPTTSSRQVGPYVSSSSGIQAFNINVGESDDYVDIRVWFYDKELTSGASYEYQRLQFVASSSNDDIPLFNGDELRPGYASVDGNKGMPRGYAIDDGIYAFSVPSWELDDEGHYAALRFFTNGTKISDPGLDLTGYTQAKVTYDCTEGMTYEVRLGSQQYDSSEHFLGEIQCDGERHTAVYTIPSNSDLTDIQSGLWFFLPTWKNVGQFYSVYLNLWDVTLMK